MKDIYNKTIEVNNKLKLSFVEQQGDKKHLKEQCNKDDKDKVQEFSAARTPMTKKICVRNMY